ncbi:hypothetical protein PFISCL1PPCAC_10277, partial [Pristionchus fissidentatus]
SFLIVSQLCLISCLAQNQRYVTVTTPQGAMQGAKLDYGTNTSGLYYGSAYGFLGVPYAQPPTGQLRFSEPVEVQQSGRIYDATYLRGRCPQSGSNPGVVSEDCLYLNVFTSQVGNASSLNAVMVFIGGDQGFTRGGANQAEIPGTVRNLVTRGVVVVTVQYRLGALGFFNLANSGVPQNLGMLDQVMALQWIQANINSFGGDPNRITLCGQSDGACAVAAHAVSPLSNGLFQQAILQSGAVYSCYQQSLPLQSTPMPSLQYNPGMQYQPLKNQQNNQQQYYQPPPPSTSSLPPPTTPSTPPSVNDEDPSMQIAMQMCNVTSDQLRAGYSNARLRTCLQSLTVDIFIQFQGYRTSKWFIVRDNSFMPNSPDALAKINPRRIPMIIGTVQDEDADYVFRMLADGSATGKTEQQLFDGWFVDFAKKNKMNSTEAGQVRNIIENNYGISQPQQNQQFYNQNIGQNNNYQPNQNYQIVGQSNANSYGPNYNYNNNQMVPQQSPNFQQTYSNTQYSQANGGNDGNGQQTMQYLQVISKIASDANGLSQSVSQVNLVQQQGSNTRIFQFTHVSDLGRSNVPNTGTWKPVFRGQDQYFLFMSETIWTTGNPTAADFRVADQMGSRWTQFAKNGQVQDWQSTPPGQYNYCNLNVNPVMQANYAPQARQVFTEQVYPIVNETPPPSSIQYPPPSPLPSPPLQNANVMVHNTNGSNSWSVSFSLPASALIP